MRDEKRVVHTLWLECPCPARSMTQSVSVCVCTFSGRGGRTAYISVRRAPLVVSLYRPVVLTVLHCGMLALPSVGRGVSLLYRRGVPGGASLWPCTLSPDIVLGPSADCDVIASCACPACPVCYSGPSLRAVSVCVRVRGGAGSAGAVSRMVGLRCREVARRSAPVA